MSPSAWGGVHHRRRRLPRWCGAAGRLVLLVPAVAVLLLLGPRPASAATLHVCPSGCPYTQLAPALAAAHSGDTITIGPGTYAGGVTIDVSVKLVGAGPGVTIISGGGPVLTIGVAGAPSEPTMTIEGVTVTGGVTVGNLTPSMGRGGGIYIPRAAGPSTGATVTIRNSVIRGNSVAPRVAIGDPPFADAGGGGISNDGTLTLDHTRVSDNLAGAASGVTTEAVGGGILNRAFGHLTLKSSIITKNRAEVTPPNGRFADGGGILVVGGTLTMNDSQVSHNSADGSSVVPSDVDQGAVAGGVHIGTDVSAAMVGNTTISDNSVTMTNTVGDATAFSGGLHVDVPVDFRMSNSVIAGNSVSSATLDGSSGNASGDSGGGQLVGTIAETHVTGNTVTVESASGDATASGNFVLGVSMTDSVVSDNHVRASSPQGSASVRGGALLVDTAPEFPDRGGLTLRDSTVRGNTGDASGPSGTARGGGIFDVALPDGPFGGPLVLINSSIIGNVLSGSAGITLQGGGLYLSDQPLTLTDSVISGNSPDQCFGC
jgi:hypothetical protein